jgi:hypothetical protein
MMRFHWVAASTLGVLLSTFPLAPQGRKAETTTVCAISREPAKFNSQWVRIPAHIESDSFEHTDIVDRACEGAGIELEYSSNLKGREELEKALHSPSPGTVDKDISGVFIGRFQWHATERTRLILILNGVESLKVVKK